MAEELKAAQNLVLARRKLVKDNVETERKEKTFFSLLIKKMQLDVNIGMLLSNVVMFFILLATGSALFNNGIHKIDTVEQAAKALEPVAGKASYLLFATGVIGTGFLAVPVLTGSLSYIVAETFGWKASFDKKFRQAPKFYGVVTLSLLLGLLINFTGISPVQGLYYTAILYGLVSPVIIAVILHIANNKKIMKSYTNGRLSNVLGVMTFLLMLASAAILIYFQIKS